MPCVQCGKSSRERHQGAVVGLSYDNKGIARYHCLDCVLEELEK